MAEVLRGDARVVSLGTLLQVAEAERISGAIRYAPGVEVGLRDGVPVRARFGALSGVDALLEMFLRPLPPFVVDVAEEPAASPLGVSVGLVLDACRLQDDWARVAPLVLAPRDGAALAGDLQALGLDGRRPVWEVVEAAAAARARVIDPLLHGLAEGHLVEAGAPVPAPPEEAPASAGPEDPPVAGRVEALTPAADDFGASVELGRRMVREGRFVQARVAFERAVALRPDDRVAHQNLRRIAALAERA